jgi:hypothetical protein
MAGAPGSPAERINLLNLAGHAPKLGATANAQTPSGYTLSWNPATSSFDLAAGGGGGGAPTGASYVVLGASNGLTAERVLTAGAGLTLVDGGAGSTVTLRVAVPDEAQGDLLVRGGQAWTRLAAGAAGRVLQSQGAGELPSYVVAPLQQPMVWCAQQMVTKRDGVRVLATVPWNPLDYPAGRTVKLQAVLATGGAWQVRVRLWNATDTEYVAGAALTRSGTASLAVTSAALTVGAQAGNLRSGSRVYEVHADIVGADTVDDIGVVGFAGLRIE